MATATATTTSETSTTVSIYKDSGYYATINSSSSKIEEQETDENGQLIAFPWDDDSFSLHLDTFPSSRLARTKYNMYPTVASPLRKYWRSSSLSDDSAVVEGEEEECDSANGSSSSSHNNNQAVPTTTGGIDATDKTGGDQEVTMMTRTKKRANKTKKTLLQIDTTTQTNFPYNNSNNSPFLNSQMNQQGGTVSSASSINRGRVEYISPLLNSSFIMDKDFASLKSRTSSIRSSSSSVVSVPGQLRGGSIITDSQISTMSESWKVASGKRRNALSPIIDQFPMPPPNVVTSPTPPPHLEEYYSPSRSGSVVSNNSHQSHHYTSSPHPHHHSPSIHSNNSSCYYLPSPSPFITASASYRSIPVPKNADSLVYFSEEPPSSIYSASGSTIREKTRYSQFFNPSYHNSRSIFDEDGSTSSKKKKKRFGSVRGGSGGLERKSSMGGLVAKLIRNIKNRFAQ